jgi:hypothetical protein
MVEPLARRDLSIGAVVLPRCAKKPGELGEMDTDAVAVSDAVSAAGEPVILCGHSYGGTVITEAGADEPNVRHLIYVTSVLPQSDGTAVLRSEQLQELFFQDCNEDTLAEALTRATPQSLAAFGQPVRRVAWREIPSTFVVCTEDRAIPVARQRAQPRRPPEPSRSPAGTTRSCLSQKHLHRSSPTQLALGPHWTPRRSCSMLCG